MSKNNLVFFTNLGAKIKVNPKDFDYIIEDKINVFKNPDLSNVRGVPPHMWAVKEGKIVIAEKSVIRQRESDIDQKRPILMTNIKKSRFTKTQKVLGLGLILAVIVGISTFLYNNKITIYIEKRASVESSLN